MLGVSKATVYSWTCKGKIPHIKLTKRLLKFREAEILAWLKLKEVTPESAPVHESSCHSTPHSFSPDDIERLIQQAKEEVCG